MNIVEVILPLKLRKTYYYYTKNIIDLYSLVKVNFNGKILVALVYKVNQKTSYENLKEILEIIPLLPLKDDHIKFLEWVSAYNLIPMGLVLKMSLIKKIFPQRFFILKNNDIPARYSKIVKLFNQSNNERSLSFLDIIIKTRLKEITINSCVDEGFLQEVMQPILKHDIEENIILSHWQTQAYKQIIINFNKFTVNLLDGVTGSGKTEVYLKTVMHLLKKDSSQQVLIMMPEIGLTSQTIDRLKKYFSTHIDVSEWHSDITGNSRYHNWQKICTGTSQVIIGARSALFLPYKNLMLIIVDEEHDTSYKDDQGEFTYNARDLAIARAKILNIPIILSSATPSMETMYNAMQGKFEHIILQSRYAGASLPNIKIVDMCKTKKITEHISEALYEEINNTLNEEKQSLLFLNRRGYAPIIMCKNCGKKINCKNCSVWLVHHKQNNTLQCHMCGFRKKYVPLCAFCNTRDSLVTYGLGIEKLAEELSKLFSTTKFLLLSSDNSNIKKDIDDIINNKYPIIIGTQISSKGYNFPHLKLVGVIDADSSFYGGDLRASEKTFQMLTQVTGRSGRLSENKGIAILQTYNPESGLIKSIANFDKNSFYKTELDSRKEAKMPPFSRLISITIVSKKEALLNTFIKTIIFEKCNEVIIFGPNKAPIYYCKNYYRYKFLLISVKKFNINKYLENWSNTIHKNNHIKIQIDIDPLNFL